MSLYKINSAKRYIIEKIPQIKLLSFLGLREGLTVSVKTIQPFGGPIVIQVGNRCIAISKEIAEQIDVKEVG